MLRFECVQQLEKAQELWKVFSPQETIYDSWDFRMLFHKYHQHEIRFYVGYVDNELIGFIPLQFNKKEKYLEFWGGSYMEDNRVMMKPGFEQYIPKFYLQIKEKAHLQCIRGNDPFTNNLPLEDYKYILPLKDISNFEDYLKKYYQAHGRKKLNKIIKNIEERKIQVVSGGLSDLHILFDLNIRQFGENSSFNDRPFHKEIFSELMSKPFNSKLNLYKLDNNMVGASFIVRYKNIVEYFNSGADRSIFEGISNYINKKIIEEAISSEAEYVDAFVGSYGWKEKWHFEKIPQHRYINDK